METIYGILFIVVTIFSIFNVISYFSDRGSIKQRHAATIHDLKPVKNLDSIGRRAFEKLYKKKPLNEASVFRVEGPIEYIGLEIDGAESREFSIGGIRIANRSVNKLRKKQVNINLEVEAAKIREDALKEISHVVEVVFLSRDIENEAGYIVKYDNWDIQSIPA
ncbi:MAG: hypothetical protein GY754_40355 [bacterium]|nr:hypothetical protein [bacterium]